MSDKTGIVSTGASGRMGQMLIKTVLESDKAKLVGCVELEGHDWVGQDIGVAMGGAAVGVTVTDDALEAFAKAQAVIDFTAPQATLTFAKAAAAAGIVHVIGTTGMSDKEIAELAPAAEAGAVIIRAGHMSLGVNLLTPLTKQVAAAPDAEYDIEIIEAHPHQPVHAPSGTPLVPGQRRAGGWRKQRPKLARYVRHGTPALSSELDACKCAGPWGRSGAGPAAQSALFRANWKRIMWK